MLLLQCYSLNSDDVVLFVRAHRATKLDSDPLRAVNSCVIGLVMIEEVVMSNLIPQLMHWLLEILRSSANWRMHGEDFDVGKRSLWGSGTLTHWNL
jgi:hypothetical protein